MYYSQLCKLCKLCKSPFLCRDARLVRSISRQAKNLASEASRSSKYSIKTILLEKSGISNISETSA